MIVSSIFSLAGWISTLVLVSCSAMQDRIVESSIIQRDSDFQIQVVVNRNVLASIVSDEIYARAYVYDCSRPEEWTPVYLSYSGIPLNRFSSVARNLNARPRDETVILVGSFPQGRIEVSHSMCVHVRGGSYLGKSIRTPPSRITYK